MGSVSEIITVSVTETTTGIRQAGFGTELYLSASVSWVERTRTYKSLIAVGADFATTTHEYRAAQRYFGQSRHPTDFVIGRLGNKPTQKRTLTPVVFNSTIYRVRVGATTVAFTSDSSATAAEIVTGLIALINAIPGVTLTATGTTTLILTENAAGGWSEVQIDPTYFALVQDHADPGVAADLAAILNENDAWYLISNPWPSKATALAIAAWAEANARVQVVTYQDTDAMNTVLAGATDIAGALKAAAYKSTISNYHPNPGAFIADGWAARRLVSKPGGETWAFTRDIAGVEPVVLTDTQKTNLLDKNSNVYVNIAGANVFTVRNDGKGGTSAQGRFFDVTRGIHWLVARVGERFFLNQANAPDKLDLAEEGIATQYGALQSVMQEGVKNKFFRDFEMGPLPDPDDISDTDRQNRNLTGLTSTGFLAGAGHTASVAINVVP